MLVSIKLTQRYMKMLKIPEISNKRKLCDNLNQYIVVRNSFLKEKI